jgi:hypothetical protein
MLSLAKSRYFFHLCLDGRVIFDNEGVRLTGLDDARREATREAPVLIIEILRTDRPLPVNDSIQIANEQGVVLHTVTFEQALG